MTSAFKNIFHGLIAMAFSFERELSLVNKTLNDLSEDK